MWHSKQVGAGAANLFREGPAPPRLTIVVLGLSLSPTLADVRSFPVVSVGLSLAELNSVTFVVSRLDWWSFGSAGVFVYIYGVWCSYPCEVFSLNLRLGVRMVVGAVGYRVRVLGG